MSRSVLRAGPAGEPGSRAWQGFDFHVGMAQMVPDKLSEVELLKLLGSWQWESIARLLGCRSSAIASADGERLYASFIDVELNLPPPDSQDSFVEGDLVAGANSVAVYANRFVEGLFLFGKERLDPGLAELVRSRADLRGIDRPWACVTNAFVARLGSNSKLKVFEPGGLAARPAERMESPPAGIAEHRAVQSTGTVEGFGDDPGTPLPAARGDAIVYRIVPESDLNGAGLLYFARYVAIMNYGERLFLSKRLERPFSTPLIACLSTERRRLYYFVNADASDSVGVVVQARVLPPLPRVARDARIGLMRLLFRIDLYRVSDGVLMASSLVRKALNVPASDKGLLAEGERQRAAVLLAQGVAGLVAS